MADEGIVTPMSKEIINIKLRALPLLFVCLFVCFFVLFTFLISTSLPFYARAPALFRLCPRRFRFTVIARHEVPWQSSPSLWIAPPFSAKAPHTILLLYIYPKNAVFKHLF
jgi:hypothetical protein